MVLRVLREATADGGVAINYVRATGILRDEAGNACGAALEDGVMGESADVHAPLIVNATGAWADFLRGEVGNSPDCGRYAAVISYSPRGVSAFPRQLASFIP
ncbi:MAG: hypothetical protein R3C44_12230 [Chloroflexota bacterium]